jgi:hypothetical protein
MDDALGKCNPKNGKYLALYIKKNYRTNHEVQQRPDVQK